MKSFEVADISKIDLKQGDFVIDIFGNIKKISGNIKDELLEMKIDEITDQNHYMKIIGSKEKIDLLRL